MSTSASAAASPKTPPTKKRKSSCGTEQTMEVDISLMRSINERLGKLEILVEMQQDLRDLRASLEFSQAQIDDIRKENEALKRSMVSIENTTAKVTRENKQLKEMLLDIQSRSMRENLMFSGIPEVTINGGIEDADKTIRDFMCKELKLPSPTVQNIAFARVHRLGKKGGRDRPIVARFERYKQKEMVKALGRQHLRKTNFWINDQYPPEINERRKKLNPILKEHRARNHRVALAVDRLYVNGELFRDPEITPWLY